MQKDRTSRIRNSIEGSGLAGGISIEAIANELKKILSSCAFSGSERLSRFLKFIVQQSIQGHADWIKESVLGVEVFGRGPSFDPRLDPIVRVEAGRLRAKLAVYYQSEGMEDLVLIELRKGGYAPVFRVKERLMEVLHIARPAAKPSCASTISAIAVLPFVNLSPDADNEYFSDGLTEEVIAVLTGIAGLKVVARSTMFAYKGRAQDIRKVGAELNVGAVLEGSVRKTQTRLRITAQLIDAVSGFHIWSQTYERELKDIFAIQQEISDAIGCMVEGYSPGMSLPVVQDRREYVEAYDLYLRGIYFQAKRSGQGLNKGLEYLKQAAGMDPHGAPILARLASSYTWQAAFGLEAPDVAMANARDAASRAIGIDGKLAQAYASRACVSALYDWDWAAAEREFRLALDLNPGVPEIHHKYAYFCLAPTGRGAEALWHMKEAKKLDPLSLVLEAAECAVLFWAGEVDQAIALGRKTLEREPTYYPTLMYLSWACRYKKMHRESIDAAELAVCFSSDTPLALASLGASYAAAGKRDEAKRVLEQLQGRTYAPSASIAYIYAAMRDFDHAFKWIDKALSERAPILAYARVARWNEEVCSDPRFGAMLEAVGIETLHTRTDVLLGH